MNPGAQSIVLIGMMGAGKSSVGRSLQQRTGLARFDTDELVAVRAGMSIPEIFARDGETHFRDLETAVLTDLAPAQSAIVVTGGGIVLREENRHRLKKLGTVVWLEADEETLFKRASRRGQRPLLETENPRARLSEMLVARTSLYLSTADLRIDTTDLTHDEVTNVILREIEARVTLRKE